MINRPKITNNYLQGKLKKFTKDEIIEAVMRSFNWTDIDLVIHRCECQRLQKGIEADKKRTAEFEKNCAEYNAIMAELQEKGVGGVSTAKLKRASELIKKITEVK